jgi:pyruvate formate lyase activating enzyme
MRIVGFQETSLVDWEGKIASVLFLGGCNFHCPFCHNYPIADDDPALVELEFAGIGGLLHRKRDWYDGVVVTGGEPMMHPEVFDLCRQIKDLGMKVKIDTNGSFPYPLKDLLEMKLADYVAMDIKAAPDGRYSTACGHPVDLVVIRRSIRLLGESGVDYEFRSTLVPGLLDPEDIPAVGEFVKGAPLFVLQHYQPQNARQKDLAGGRTYSRDEAEAMAEKLRPFVREVRLRGKFL